MVVVHTRVRTGVGYGVHILLSLDSTPKWDDSRTAVAWIGEFALVVFPTADLPPAAPSPAPPYVIIPIRGHDEVPFKFARLHSPSSDFLPADSFPPFLSLLPPKALLGITNIFLFCFLDPILDGGSSDISQPSLVLPLHSFAFASCNWFRYPKERLTCDCLAGPLHWEPTVGPWWLELLLYPSSPLVGI